MKKEERILARPWRCQMPGGGLFLGTSRLGVLTRAFWIALDMLFMCVVLHQVKLYIG
ncbi:hypothetical protein OIU84_004103, partial [Salix udensis]